MLVIINFALYWWLCLKTQKKKETKVSNLRGEGYSRLCSGAVNTIPTANLMENGSAMTQKVPYHLIYILSYSFLHHHGPYCSLLH